MTSNSQHAQEQPSGRQSTQNSIGDSATAELVAPAQEKPVSRKQFIQLFLAVMMPMIMATMDQTLMATATPVVAGELGGLSDSSWIATAYLLAIAVTITVYGRLGDRYGRRHMMVVALGVFVAGSIVSGSAQSMGHLIIGRAIQGLGAGGLMTLSQALIGELVPPRQRARFQGYFAVLFASVNLSAPILGGFITAYASWRVLYFVNLPLAAVAVWRLYKLPAGEKHPDAPGVDDRVGLVLLTVAVLSMLYGVSSAGHRFDWVSWQTAACLAISVAGWAALLWHENRHRAPFFPLELMRIRALRLSLITLLCNTFCWLALIFYLPVYLQIGMHVDVDRSGLLMVPVLLGMVSGATIASRLVGRTGKPAQVPVIGLAVAAIGFAALGVWPSGVVPAVLFAAIAAATMGPTFPMTQLIAQSLASREHLGASVGLVLLFRTIGGVLGTAVVGAVIYGLLPDVDVAELMKRTAPEDQAQVQQAFHVAFLVCAFVAAFGAFNARRVPEVRL